MRWRITIENPEDGAIRFRTAWWQRLASDPSTYEIARFAVLRLLAFVYLVAFRVARGAGGAPLWRARAPFRPRSFWRGHESSSASTRTGSSRRSFGSTSSDAVLRILIACAAGVALSAAACAGVSHGALQLALWALYASFVHVGQIFYGYGWEFQLLETGMIAVFLAPWSRLGDAGPLPGARVPPVADLASSLARLSGHAGLGAHQAAGRFVLARSHTCLDTYTHFETQPNPNPASFWFHHAPHALHVAGVLLNHAAELVAPWFVFGVWGFGGARRARHIAGAIIVVFQVTLIVSGNLSFLNWLTLVPALACFDDALLTRAVPRSWRWRESGSSGALPGCQPPVRRIADGERWLPLSSSRS